MDGPAGGVARAWVAAWHPDRLVELGTIADARYVHHTMSGMDIDLEGFAQGLVNVFAAFPDMRYEVLHLVGEGDLVAVGLVGTGVHGGDFFGIAPTGREVSFRGMYHCRVADGKIVEDWDVFDLLTPALRLGASLVPQDNP